MAYHGQITASDGCVTSLSQSGMPYLFQSQSWVTAMWLALDRGDARGNGCDCEIVVMSQPHPCDSL